MILEPKYRPGGFASSGRGDKRAAEQKKGRFLQNQVSPRSLGEVQAGTACPSCIFWNRFSFKQLLILLTFPGFTPPQPVPGGMIHHPVITSQLGHPGHLPGSQHREMLSSGNTSQGSSRCSGAKMWPLQPAPEVSRKPQPGDVPSPKAGEEHRDEPLQVGTHGWGTGSVQGQTGWVFNQTGVVERVPANGRQVGSR